MRHKGRTWHELAREMAEQRGTQMTRREGQHRRERVLTHDEGEREGSLGASRESEAGKEREDDGYRVYSQRRAVVDEGPGQRTEDISRCRPTYHSFAAADTVCARSVHKLRSAKVHGTA